MPSDNSKPGRLGPARPRRVGQLATGFARRVFRPGWPARKSRSPSPSAAMGRGGRRTDRTARAGRPASGRPAHFAAARATAQLPHAAPGVRKLTSCSVRFRVTPVPPAAHLDWQSGPRARRDRILIRNSARLGGQPERPATRAGPPGIRGALRGERSERDSVELGRPRRRRWSAAPASRAAAAGPPARRPHSLERAGTGGGGGGVLGRRGCVVGCRRIERRGAWEEGGCCVAAPVAPVAAAAASPLCPSSTPSSCMQHTTQRRIRSICYTCRYMIGQAKNFFVSEPRSKHVDKVSKPFRLSAGVHPSPASPVWRGAACGCGAACADASAVVEVVESGLITVESRIAQESVSEASVC
jgi:hypothetical protein